MSDVMESPSRLRVSGRSVPQTDLNDAGHRSPETGLGEGSATSAAPYQQALPQPLPQAGGELEARSLRQPPRLLLSRRPRGSMPNC